MSSAFKMYMLSVMKGQKKGFVAWFLRTVLRVLSWLYALAIKTVDWAYRSGLRRVHRVKNIPVVSVGNITLGGTGKTPFTIFLANYFSSSGKKPAVLIRGYGDDERRMLCDEMPEVPVFAGQDRVASALAAIRNGRDILVLDDGFQHRRIGRDLNIVMLDSGSIFGNGDLFPRGILREPVSSLKRADILVLSKIDKVDDKGKNDIIRKLENSFPGKLIVTARHRPTFLKDVTGTVYSAETLKGQKVCLVSGIADPEYFARVLEDLGALPVLRYDYADHHIYSQKEIDKISVDCRQGGIDSIVTTKKDYVKMRLLDLSAIEERLYILDIEMDIVEGKEALVDRLNSVVSGNRG